MRPPATSVHGRILVVKSPSGNGSRSTPDAESEAAAIVTKVTVGNMSNCRFGRCGALAVSFQTSRRKSGACRAWLLWRHPAPASLCGYLRDRSFSLEDCLASGSLTPGAAQFLSRMIEAKLLPDQRWNWLRHSRAACRQGVGEISRPLVPWGLPESGWCVRVRTRRYSLPNSDNPSLHPSIMNKMKNQTVPMIVAIMENILALLECS